MIDATDIEILTLLQDNARTSNAEIARRVGLAPSAISERVKKLEERGIIQGYTARIDPRAVGLGLAAFVFVRSDEPVGRQEAGEQLAALPQVQEVHHIAGEDCYLVKLRAAGTEELGRLLRETLGAIESVKSTRTTIVLTTLKDYGGVPLAAPAGTGGGER